MFINRGLVKLWDVIHTMEYCVAVKKRRKKSHFADMEYSPDILLNEKNRCRTVYCILLSAQKGEREHVFA